MRFKLNIPEFSIKNEYSYYSDVLNEGKEFPVLTIGRDSYIEEVMVDNVLDANLIYNVQIGRYSSIAHDVTFIVDMNHDYKNVCQGRISGVVYNRPQKTKRKGQIIIMNDCWIGEKATILSGVKIGNGAVVAAEAVVTKDVPDYAIVAGNPAKIIGYRFEETQIEALKLIRWWNWDESKILLHANELYSDIDTFIKNHIEEAKKDFEKIPLVDITPIEKIYNGEEKRFLYVPDFEQDYPTYPQVIDAFVNSYAETNAELVLYIKEDSFLEDKLDILENIFEKYDEKECYVNLYVGNLEDKIGLFSQIDSYITNRSLDNVKYIDIADMFGIPVISGVDLPIFRERSIGRLIKHKEESVDNQMIRELVDVMKHQNSTINDVQDVVSGVCDKLSQISVNQYAMNCSVNNLKFEILDSETPVYPTVENGEKAVDMIIEAGKSMCRFGDGEFAVIAGENRQKFQHANEELAERLKEVLASDDENIIVCIADMYGDLSKYNDDCRYNIRAYMKEDVRKAHYQLLDMSRIYYDTFLTRPYASYLDNNTDAPMKRFKKLKRIWQGRKLLIIEGEKTRMGIGNDLFAQAGDIIRILGPAKNAFDKYKELLSKALEQDKDRLVLIAMGATATVLAFDLSKAGYQALDIGHIDIEYEWMLAGEGRKTQVKNKYNNEVSGGDIVEDIYDSVYESQIIARIV